MNDKDEIRSLNLQVNSLKYQIRQLDDYKEENIRLKKVCDAAKEGFDKIRIEKDNVENNISVVFNSFKKLIHRKGMDYSKLKTSSKKDLIERMKKDNKNFEEKIIQLDIKSKALLDDLYSKIKQYCSGLNSGAVQENIKIDIEAMKYNLQNISSQFTFIFNEIQNILNLSSQFIAEEEEETLKNINMIEIIIEEIERLLRFVPINELMRNNILAQLRINPNNYPMNMPTIRIILTNFQEVKRKRQTQLRSILDQIKIKSANILIKKADIEKEIENSMNIINNNDKDKKNSNNKEGEINIENIFSIAIKTNQKNIGDFKSDIIENLSKEIQEYEDNMTAETLNEEDLITQVKSEFAKKWNKIKNDGCNILFEQAKNESNIFFESKLINYQKFDQIVQVFKDKFSSPDCDVIKLGLLHCNQTIDKIKKDIKPIKCVILIGKKNEYLENLNANLVKNLPFLIYNENKTINEIYFNIDYNIKNITFAPAFEVVFPIIVVHFNEYKEFEKENNNIEKLIINCLKKKVAFLFFFNITNNKELANINKKINTFIEKSSSIQTTLKDTKYEISKNLGNNMTSIEFGAKEEMDKLTKFKKDIRCIIDKNELKNEYFNKMFDVYNTHSIVNDLLGIKNAQNEITSRNRLLSSIFEYVLISVNLDKKPKTRQLKEKEEIDLNQKIGIILEDIYNNSFIQDFNIFIHNLIQKKTFDLYLEREKLMADLDLQYNTSLLTEESDNEKIKKFIYGEIQSIIDKKHKNELLKYIGRFVWSSFFDRFCPKFYILFEVGFKIPEDFDQYLVDSLNK